ncbi:MAG TPA: peroxiredoxin [Acidimicrobiales bacterium]|nr:peroxiredoxin [Acidimicrobiales bacterium]
MAIGDSERDGATTVRVGVGDPAPLFSLPGTGGRTYSLGDLRGSTALLVFYPADFTPVCTQQLRSYSEDLSAFTALGAVVWCLSPQDVDSHERFSAEHRLGMPLLADTDKQVGEAYGILGPLGFYRRSVFVVDGGGIIRFARRSLSSMTYIPAQRLVEAIRSTTA